MKTGGGGCDGDGGDGGCDGDGGDGGGDVVEFVVPACVVLVVSRCAIVGAFRPLVVSLLWECELRVADPD